MRAGFAQHLGGWKTIGAGLATGGLLILILPDFGLWFLAPVALTPLLWALGGLSTRRAFLVGWLAGAVANIGIFHWIAQTAITMSDFSLVAALGVLLAFSLYAGLQYAVLAVLARPLSDRRYAVATVPAAVVAVEFLWPNLFPWHLGNAVYRVPVLMQGMDITGVYGASFVAACVATTLAWAGRRRARREPMSWRPVGLAVLLVGTWVAYGLLRLDGIREAPAPHRVRLALVQPDITAEEKKHRDNASRKVLYERLERLTLEAAREGLDAIVWPEGAFPFYFATDAEGRTGWRDIVETSRRLTSLVQRIRIPLLFGTLARPVGSRTRNSMVLLGPDGAEVARYDKRVLLAFGEYMPLSDAFPFLKNRVKEVSDMEAGSRAVAFRLGPALAVASICYEAIFPSLTRDSVSETGADLIVNLTNDAWFGVSGAPAQHLMVQVPRAVELRVPLVRVTETGITAVVLPSGDFAFETGLHERRVDRVEVPVAGAGIGPAAPPFSFYRVFGDVFAWVCVLATAAALALDARRRRAAPTH